jgi:hypothetical protein
VSQSGPIEFPLVALIGGARHNRGFDDGDAVLQQILGCRKSHSRQQADQRRVEAAEFARMRHHGSIAQCLRQWPVETLRPTH